jgi:autotransporter-associated beta strand protein
MKSKPISRLSFPLASAIAALLAVQSVSATNYYWDVNGTTAGFSTVVGAWNGTNAFWGPNASGTGGTYIASPTTSDDLFVTAAATNTGSITLTGTQSAGSLTFGATVGAVTLTGGTALDLGAAATIAASNWQQSNVISMAITGAGTSLTKIGNGGLNLQGANTYSGETILNGYWQLGNTTISGAAGTISTSSGITFNGTLLTLTNVATQGAVDRLNSSAASLITSNGGTLNYGNANTAANTYAETAGTLTLTRGQFNTALTTDQTTSNGQTLTLGGLTQTGTSAVTFSAGGTGPQASGLKNMIVVTGAGTSAFIAPWATVGTTSALQSDYAAYNANYVVPANIAASAESTWMTSTDAYTSSGSTALSGDRTMAALRNTGATATITLSDGVTGYKLATTGILNGVGTLLTIAPGAVAGSVTVLGASGGNLYVTPGSGAITISAPINDNGGAVTLVKNGALALTLSNATSNYSGGTVINGGPLNFVTGALGTTGNITINSVSNIGTNQAGAARLQWGASTNTDLSSRLTMVNSGYAILDTGGNTVTFSNAIGSSSSSGLGKTGTGTLNLNGINTYTGATDVYAGTLVLGAANASTSVRVGNGTSGGGAAGAILRLGASNVLSSNVPIIVDGQGVNTLDLNGFNQTIGHLSLGSNNGGSSGTVSGSGSSTLTLTDGVTSEAHNQSGNTSGSITVPFLNLNGVTQNLSIFGYTNSTRGALAISSVIQNGGINRTGSVAGIVSLSNANTFSGATTISVGVLRLDNSLALQNSPFDTTASVTGGADNGLRLNTGITSVTLGGLNGNKSFAATGGIFSTTSNNYASVTALTLNPALGASPSYSGIIANGASGMTLTKTGAGTQILSNNNTYTGGTNVNAGTLLLSGAFNMPTTGTLTVNAGGNFSLADGTVRDTTAAALNLATGALLTFDWSSDGIVDKLTSTAAATTTGNVGIRINPIGTPTGSGLTMLSAGSGLETAGGTKYFLANNIDYTATLTQSDTAVTIGNYATASSLTNAYWLGGQVTGALGAMALSSGTSSNWASAADGTLAGGVVPNGSTVNVIFGATGAAEQSNVTTGADMNLGSITFNDSAAVIVGGSNNITLNSASGTAASTTAALATVTPGSAISVTSFANAINSISANISMAASQTWNVASGKTLAVSGIVSGAFGLTKADAGTLALSGVNTYSGSTTLAAGILGAGESASLGNGGTSNALFFNGGSLQALGGITSPVTRGVMMTSNGSIDSNSFSVSIAGLVSGSGNLTKNGVGTLTLSGVNSSFSGRLTVANDTLTLSNAAAAGTGAININTGAATNATVQTNGAMTLTNPITVTAGSIGTNTLTNTSHATNFSGLITANENLTISNLGSVASVTVFAGGASVASGKTITLHTENSGGIIANGIITGNGKVATTSNSSGEITISGASNYTGGFTLGANVTHVISTSSAGADGNPTDGPFGAGATAAILGTGSIRSTATADTTIKNVITLAGDLTVPAIASEKSLIFTGPATLTGNRFFTVYMSDLTKSLAFLGAIGDGGSGYAFNKDGGGTMTFGGSNTYTGVTTVYSGTLEFAGGSQASPITVSSGASLGFTLGSPTTTTKDVDISLGTIKITGTPTLPSYDLITSSVSITGTPVLAAAIPGYELKVESNILKLKQAGYASWAAFNGASANLSDDHDNDGVSNGIEYFIGGPAGNTTGFTALPNVVKALDGTLSVTWTKAATYTGTYGTDFVVETSSSLTGTWTTEIADPNLGFTVTFPSATEVKFTFPSGPPYSGKNFARLKVTGP